MVRFGLVGLINTAVGLSIIFGMMYLGTHPVLANMIGYACGLCVSYVLNSRWTFQEQATTRSFLLFLLTFGISYLVNLGVLIGLSTGMGVGVHLAQLAAVCSYSLTFFVLSKFVVFRA